MPITGLSPNGGPVEDTPGKPLAARPMSLGGATLAVLSNGLFNSGVFFDALVEELAVRDAYADVVRVTKDSRAVPPRPEEWESITASATIAITGFGGCGSCSARSMRDALELEWAGIPSLLICHSALQPSAAAIARIAGHPDYPMFIVDYPYAPLATWTDEEAETLGRAIAPEVRDMLVAAPALDAAV